MSNCNIVYNSIPTKKGIPMNNIEHINEQRMIEGFYREYQAEGTQIAYKHAFMARERIIEDIVNFMPIVDHPEERVVLKPAQFARIHAKHPDENKQFLNNIILVLGTPYGIVVFHAREKDYRRTKSGQIVGTVPHMHTTISFTKMAMRVFKRKGIRFNGAWDMKNWIWSPTFQTDLEEQMDIDFTQKIAIDDGLPARRRAQHPVAKTQPRLTSHDVKKQGGKKPFFKKSDVDGSRRQSAPRDGNHPLDIVPCRANGWKGTRYVDQTPEQRAEGLAMLANPEEQLAGFPV